MDTKFSWDSLDDFLQPELSTNTDTEQQYLIFKIGPSLGKGEGI